MRISYNKLWKMALICAFTSESIRKVMFVSMALPPCTTIIVHIMCKVKSFHSGPVCLCCFCKSYCLRHTRVPTIPENDNFLMSLPS